MRKLQSFDYTSSRYERPNQDWICGHAADGRACLVGPDSRGRCCTSAECQPRRDGDRWLCTRPASFGGACDPGPLGDGTCGCPIPPCVPVRSLRARRSLTVRWTVAATLGFIALVLGSAGLAWLMPGPLTQAHVALENCQSCHATVSSGAFGWVHSAFAAAAPERDSGLCLDCHIVSERPMLAHGVDVELLAVKTRQIETRLTEAGTTGQGTGQGMLFPASFPAQASLTCATCHVEHRGTRQDLTNIPVSTCQTCHVQQFDAFSRGHPAFADYPYDRRTRIVFDHTAHFSRHFPETAGKRPDLGRAFSACVDCHVPATEGRLMATGTFDATCAACHTGQIRGRDRAIGPRGVAFLAIPGIDAESLEQRGYRIGNWPRQAEAQLTPYMSLMLSADPATREAMKTAAALDLLDLRDASDDEAAAVYRLAWAVKRLLHDLATDATDILRDHMPPGGTDDLGDTLLGSLTAALPHDVLASAAREWLPDLERDLADFAAGKMRSAPAVVTPARTAASSAKPALQDTGDILAAPKKDTGDILATPKKDTGDILAAPKKDTGDILAAPKKDTGDILAAPKKDTGDILAAPKKDTGDILATPKKDTGDILAAPRDKVETRPVATEPSAAQSAPFNPEAFMDLGGWYRQDFAILFMPTGHADPFLKAWFDYATEILGKAGTADADPIFRDLARKDAPGQCTKCHSVDADAIGNLSINWQPRRTDGVMPGFTRFSHAPHLQLGPERGCLTCHQIDRDAAFLKAFEGNDPHAFQSNFKPIEKETCTACHMPQAAGDSCLLCHAYHVAPVATPAMKTSIDEAVAGNATHR